ALQVLLEEESVSRAAERLHVTQSAMSKMLTRLSDLFGEELFFRGTQGIRATERALELQTPLSELLEQLGRLVSPPEFVVSDCDRTFRISLLDSVAARLCPPLLARIVDEAPKVNIEMKP
ncbi:LysR family transcriptional regulator, partial [Oleiphilus sp. HI0067]